MAKVWRFATHDSTRVGGLSRQLKISPLLAQVLVARGVSTPDDAQRFLTARMMDLHDPEGLPGITEAADRIVSAIRNRRQITIYGDYDVDGVTACSLLWHCVTLAGGEADYYIPHRLEEGYGLNAEALRQLHAEDSGRLVVTVDCGITSVADAELARELGLELIITDHHTLADSIPNAAAVVHPGLPHSSYPFRGLCGAGVAFKLAWAVCQRLGDGAKASPRMREFLKGAVGLAAVGTIADVVPLRDENRILVRYGLSSLVENATPGIKALLKVSELAKQSVLSEDDIGFAIAPRINAAGRLGQARLAVELLTTQSPERAATLASYLDELNKNRRTVERRILKQAREMVEANEDWQSDAGLVLADHDWHAGVIGIVASRVAEHFQKPTILVSLNSETHIGQGSGRTFAGFDLHSGVLACADHLETFGGHKAAVGLKIHSDRIDEFRKQFSRYVGENHAVASCDVELRVDSEVSFTELTRHAVMELDKIGPFGCENPRPLFVANHVRLAEPPRRLGGGGRHLSLTLKQHDVALRAIAFGKGDWADDLERLQGEIAICFAPSINRFRGFETVQLELRDWQRMSEVGARNARIACAEPTKA